jgi:hypothetical protein
MWDSGTDAATASYVWPTSGSKCTWTVSTGPSLISHPIQTFLFHLKVRTDAKAMWPGV